MVLAAAPDGLAPASEGAKHKRGGALRACDFPERKKLC